jgi:hypothetical protein
MKNNKINYTSLYLALIGILFITYIKIFNCKIGFVYAAHNSAICPPDSLIFILLPISLIVITLGLIIFILTLIFSRSK